MTVLLEPKLLLEYWIVSCVDFFYMSLYPRVTDQTCSSLHQRKWSPQNVKEDINRWSLEEKRLNKRWKVKKSGGVKSIEKIENDRKDLSFSRPSGKIKNNPASEKRWKSHKGSPWWITVQNSPPALLKYNSISFCLVLKVLFGGLVESWAYLSAAASIKSSAMFYICPYRIWCTQDLTIPLTDNYCIGI